ncbi:hypothetical protein AB1K83_02180 [Sporosarcina sp. 179-K 3D1 HS]|uniref:hypothetical protein n=1 Tax=Sporosarcina sp. 179-K 3D1 HS TaxID=3232169 RepID=UPI0039A0D1F4
MWKRVAVCLAVFIGGLLSLPSMMAMAAPSMEVKAVVGFEGKAKYGKGAPLSITVENSGTSPFQGDLVIDVPFNHQTGNGVAIPLHLDAGETYSTTIVIPAVNDWGNFAGQGRAKSIFLYEGGWKKGKEILHKGAQFITTSLVGEETRIILPLTDNIDRLAAMKKAQLANWTGGQFTISKLGAEKFPEDAAAWGSVDFIVVDEYPLSDLSNKKQEAVVQWIRSGGTLIIGGSDNLAAEAGIFNDTLPMRLKGKSETDVAPISSWADTNELNGTVSTFETILNPGAMPILEEDGKVLVAYSKIGQGHVIQTAFSVGDAPLADMAGMTAVWNQLFAAGEKNQSMRNWNFENPSDAIVHTIGSANGLFPSFKVSAPLLFGIIVIYIILIIPVLYFVLKKKDKREHAWWIIPGIALLTSVGIFTFGAKDRIGSAQIQHSAVLHVEPDGELTGYYAESILSNKSGDFTFTSPSGTNMYAELPRDRFTSNLPSVHKHAILEKDSSGSTLYLRNVGYWNVATLYGTADVETQGEFEAQLTVEDKNMTGTVTNGFPFPLTDISIWSGNKLIPLGELGPGETLQVNETLKSSTLVPKRSLYNPYMGPGQQNRDDLHQMRKDGLTHFAGEYMKPEEKPFLIGYADTQIIPVQLEQRTPSVSSMTMLMQPITVQTIFGDSFEVDSDMMSMMLRSQEHQFEAHPVGYVPDQYYFDEAIYIQTWQLPEQLRTDEIEWTGLTLSKIQKSLYDANLLNTKTGEFEDAGFVSSITVHQNVQDYISPDGKITVRMTFKDSRHGNEGKAPVLTLNGEVAK